MKKTRDHEKGANEDTEIAKVLVSNGSIGTFEWSESDDSGTTRSAITRGGTRPRGRNWDPTFARDLAAALPTLNEN